MKKLVIFMIAMFWMVSCSEKADIGPQSMSFEDAFTQAVAQDKKVLVYFFSPT